MPIVLDGTAGITTPSVDAATINATDVTATKEVSAPQVNAGNIVGQVCFFGMTTVPDGFLKANGAAVSRTTFAALFSAIGTTYGVGDGSTTFTLPDLRGEFPRGWDDGRTVDAARAFGSAQSDSFQTHGHTVTRASEATAIQNNGQTVVGVTGGGTNVSGRWAARAPTTFGQGTPRVGSETRPRNVALLGCIKF